MLENYFDNYKKISYLLVDRPIKSNQKPSKKGELYEMHITISM